MKIDRCELAGRAGFRVQRLRLTTALVPLFLPLATFAAAPTAAPSVEQTISYCEQGVQCPINSQAFLDGTPQDRDRDANIMVIVSTLAETANTPLVPMKICLEAAEGMVVLSQGLIDLALKDQVASIAAAMCLDTSTAAIAGGDDGGGTGGGDGGGGTGGGDGGGGTGGGDGGGGTGGGDGGGGTGGGDGGGGTGGGDGGGGTGGGDGGGGTGGSSKNKSGGADGTNPGNGGNDTGYNNPGGTKNN